MNARGRMPTRSMFENLPVTNKDGNPIVSPTNAFEVSDFDTTANPIYVGQVRSDGAWTIVKYDTDNGQARYCQGTSGYTTAWTNRSSQSYDYYYNAF